ncbi:Oligopeptide/dipeptide ABC transporter, ATP-binding protein-like protein [Rubrobacter xylanophilus DSM 9941]|uniref:Oligopeptide/dipeptide ABC transporter, ATP-binding protein-like protein n=1 Tax=Rubrobacter xylanophilus (strain DSM 9941 / JCM 11954 / NBRC 16129 / PRD-1) TaxID=266117 RepID=Q1ARP3_RUBXD|nr:ABC transporter ATP-binding protein [Rubrobacter xylanophilus]ABG05935.1 Oligopeptide/dipeptide ABC transporter, ATP-binding protein-like protein [Rubrobacter xylanophilus DSM 9941]
MTFHELQKTDGGVVLDVRNLSVAFRTEEGEVRAVDGVSFVLRRGEVLAVVGESGSGKSVTALTILGLTRQKNARHAGEILYGERNLLAVSEKELRRLRGAELAMIFQDPLTSLNPLQRVGQQIAEMLRLHRNISRKQAWREAERLLAEVGIPRPEERARCYPHEFSGGMRQRAMIAMALACDPKVLIADEPTTALDVTIQAQILDLIKRLKDEHHTGVILITHDLGVVAEIADRIAVMYAGRVVEEAPRDELFYDPQHPYTWGLLGSVPRVDSPRGKELRPIEGIPPSITDLPPGCRFRPRCSHAFDRCIEEPPLETRLGRSDHSDACWLSPKQKRALRGAVIGRVGETA